LRYEITVGEDKLQENFQIFIPPHYLLNYRWHADQADELWMWCLHL